MFSNAWRGRELSGWTNIIGAFEIVTPCTLDRVDGDQPHYRDHDDFGLSAGPCEAGDLSDRPCRCFMRSLGSSVRFDQQIVQAVHLPRPTGSANAFWAVDYWHAGLLSECLDFERCGSPPTDLLEKKT